MTFIISTLIIFATLLALLSGVWVIVGLVTELVNPSNTSNPSSGTDPGPESDAQKKQNSSELL